MRISWSTLAQESIIEIVAYYEEEVSFELADRAEGEIFQQVEKIRKFPRSIPVSDVFPELRKLVIQGFPFVAFLRVNDDVIEVVDVIHTSRKIPKEK
jgi:plasmid stabilization system protein ParE